MTLVSILSVSGAPGVSTLACLLASTWPVPGPVAVVECDPSGGDLAARFGLSSSVGWPSLTAAVRRTGSSTPLGPHLQNLPGGLPVLVGARPGTPVGADSAEAAVVRTSTVVVRGANGEGDGADWIEGGGDGGVGGDGGDGGDDGGVGDGAGAGSSGLVVIDLGRLPPGTGVTDGWLEAADWTVIVVRDDPAGAVRVRDRSAELLARTDGRLGLIVVGVNGFRCSELTELTGLVPLGDVPFDPGSAAVASGASGAGRRLERSQLLAAVRRVGVVVADRTAVPVTRRRPDRPGDSDPHRGPERVRPGTATELAIEPPVAHRPTHATRWSSIWPGGRRRPVGGRA